MTFKAKYLALNCLLRCCICL